MCTYIAILNKKGGRHSSGEIIQVIISADVKIK